MSDAARKVVVDSGPLIALFDAGDTYHLAALEFVRQTRAKLISTMAVITEAMYVLEGSLPARNKHSPSWPLILFLIFREPFCMIYCPR